MAQLYKKYMRLLSNWPVDKTRAGDLGQHIREQVKTAFSKGESSKIQNQELCEKKYQSLDRIATNYYAKKYPHSFKKTSTGLTQELCTLALSKEGQEELQRANLGFFAKVKKSISRAFSKDQHLQQASKL